MKTRSVILAVLCCLGLSSVALAQTPKPGGEKKAPAPKTPADLAYDEFNKVRTQPGGKLDQARFQKMISAGVAYLTQYPTHGRVNDGIRDLAFFATTIDRKQAAVRTSFASFLKLEVTNQRYKEGHSEAALAVLAALDAAVADFDVRDVSSEANLATLREKIDTLAQTPGGTRFLAERERSYSHVLMVSPNPARAEVHLRKLLEHPEKAVVTMARDELNIIDAKKTPYELKFTALDGKDVDLAQLRGKVVALYFWSSGNKSATGRFAELKQVYSMYRKRGFELVTVSYDKAEDREKLEKFIKENKIAWPVYFDGKAAKNDFGPKLNATAVPRLYVFDQKGILQTTVAGAPVARVTADFPSNQLEPKVKQLLGIK